MVKTQSISDHILLLVCFVVKISPIILDFPQKVWLTTRKEWKVKITCAGSEQKKWKTGESCSHIGNLTDTLLFLLSNLISFYSCFGFFNLVDFYSPELIFDTLLFLLSTSILFLDHQSWFSDLIDTRLFLFWITSVSAWISSQLQRDFKLFVIFNWGSIFHITSCQLQHNTVITVISYNVILSWFHFWMCPTGRIYICITFPPPCP